MSHQSAPSHRLTESAPGTILGVMMALMWIASMSMADSNPCTILPFLWGFMAVILITICCTLRHYKIVRLPLTAWLSLAIGAYFLVRAMTGFSLTDNWTDTGLIIFAFMFYLVGIYTGQSADTRSYTIILSSAIVLNLISMYFMQDRNLSLHWLGRADVSLLGPNGRNVTLFAYKNFAALFLALSGSLLLWQHLWCKDKRPTKLLPLALALGAIVASFFCGSRVVWFVVPLLFAGGWVLWLVLSLYDEAPIGWGIIGGGMLILTGVLIAVYDFIFGHTLAQALVDIDSHLRYLIWDNVLRATHEAPLHGFGAGGALWEIVTWYKEWQLPNYAHNEYVQVWADYGLIGLVLMLLLLLPDGNALGHFSGKEGVFLLGAGFTLFHELYGKGKAQSPGKEGVFQHLGLFRLHLDAGVALPDLIVGVFLLGQAEQGLLIFLALGKGGDFCVNNTFRQLVLLHLLDDGQSLLGYGCTHKKSSLVLFFYIIYNMEKIARGTHLCYTVKSKNLEVFPWVRIPFIW